MNAPIPNLEELRRAAPQSGFRVKALAVRVGMDVRTLERRFGEELLTTPKSWIRQERISTALPLLAAGFSNKEVAERLGYTHSTNFGRDFKRVFGCPPRKYFRRKPAFDLPKLGVAMSHFDYSRELPVRGLAAYPALDLTNARQSKNQARQK